MDRLLEHAIKCSPWGGDARVTVWSRERAVQHRITDHVWPFGHTVRKARGMNNHAILVVDDDKSIRSTISELLKSEGYAVETAANGAEALRLMGQSHPSLVLLDMRMPIVNGWEFARTLRERGIMVPILVMTAASDARSWAREIGAQGYLAKPFDLDDLLLAVERIRAQGGDLPKSPAIFD
jgi:CheY-like chemotaxis protein